MRKLITIVICLFVIVVALYYLYYLKETRKIESFSPLKNGELKNMNDLKNETVPIFIFVYAPWCPHCEKMMGMWGELEEKYKSNDKIIIKKINSDEKLFKEFSKVHKVDSFPTLLLLKDNKSMEYEEGRDKESLVRFIGKN
jgi:thiol-disulfide isomerase/thioredoxin